jgi:hypothetical protein
MRKFTLFSRSALTSMAAVAGLAPSTAEEAPDGEDPEAGPVPDDGEEEVVGATDEGTGVKPKDKPEGEPEAGVEVVTLADAQAHAAAKFADGRKAERERVAAVLGSDQGKANTAMAAFMLSTSPDASADDIIKHLSTMPSAPVLSASPVTIPDTNVDLGKPGAASAATGETGKGSDVWDEVQGTGASAPVVSSDASRATLAAIAAGAKTVNTGGNANSAPAVVPTGN